VIPDVLIKRHNLLLRDKREWWLVVFFFTKYLESYREVMKSIDDLNTSPVLKGIGKLLTILKMLMDIGISIALLAILVWKVSGLL
tara:strand:+ start:32858 stop:33112 length:255 start_codon:yes stop_codon:yes gene_type:complete